MLRGFCGLTRLQTRSSGPGEDQGLQPTQRVSSLPQLSQEQQSVLGQRKHQQQPPLAQQHLQHMVQPAHTIMYIELCIDMCITTVYIDN